MRVGVLGPVELVQGGRRVALGGIKQRTVLGLLAARRGAVVSVDELIDGLWPEGPQASPRKTVQVYVTRLRRALGPQAEAITSEPPGYRFDPTVVPVDADEFAAGLDAARRVGRADDAAVAALRDALAWWRGSAFADVRESPAIVPAAVALDQERQLALHELFEREVRVRPHQVLAELERAVEADPFDEALTAHLMVARYRVGRPADALAAYRTLRRRLGDDLGLEPSPPLRELEGRILRHELDGAPPPIVATPDRQRRRITALALGLRPAPGLDAEEEAAALAPVRTRARAAITDRGGTVLADTGDGLLAAFGYPALDESAARAVAVALELRDHVAELDGPVRLAAGLDTGAVVVDDAGGGLPTTMVGAPLREAQRWRAAADDGAVVLGAATLAVVGERFETAPGTGSSATVVRARPGPAIAASHLVGRAVEQAALRAAVGDADHRLCAVLVLGGPGTGKTALVRDLLAARDDGEAAVWIQGGAGPADWTGVAPAGSPEWEPTARSLAAAVRHRWGGDHGVVVADAVEQMDEAAVAALTDLPDHLPSGVLVLTARPGPLVAPLVATFPAVVVGPLGTGAVRELVRARAGSRLPPDVLNVIVDRSGGLPLVATALGDAVRAGVGDLTRAVPDSLYDAAMVTLDRLGEARALAQRAAVFGGRFDLADLVRIGEVGDVEAGLTALVAAGVVHPVDGGFQFASAVFADAAHDSMLLSERMAVHGRLADEWSAAPTAEPARVAYHLEHAGRVAEAAAAWTRAAGDAVRRARHDAAARHARRALTLLDDPAAVTEPDSRTRARALLLLAVALQSTTHGSEELRDVLARRWALGVDDIGVASLLSTIGVSNLQALGDFRGAEEAATQALLDAETAGDARALALAHHFLGATLVWAGERDEGLAELERSLKSWQETPSLNPLEQRTVAALWTLRALVAAVDGQSDEALSALTTAREAVPLGDGYGECLVEVMVALIGQLGVGPVPTTEQLERRWVQALDLGSDFWATRSQALLGWATARDDPGAGIGLMTEAIETGPTEQMVPYFLGLLADGWLRAGDPAAAQARVVEARELADATGERLWLPVLDEVDRRVRAALDQTTESRTR